MTGDTIVTIGTAFDRRLKVEVIGRHETAEGVNLAHIVLPSGLSAWVKPTSLRREIEQEPSALAAHVEAKPDPVTEVGMYAAHGAIFKVQESKTSGNLYAKRLVQIGGKRLTDEGEVVHFEFQYDQGAIRSLKPEHRMTLDEAKHFGIQYGVCCVCGITLKDATSVAAGIGPVCATRL